MTDYVRTQGDLANPLSAQLSDINGPIDLEEGCVVTFESRLLGATGLTTEGLAEVVAPGAPVGHPQRGIVVYDPVADDVATAGIYFVKWRVQFPGNPSTIVQSFPAGSAEVMLIQPTV